MIEGLDFSKLDKKEYTEKDREIIDSWQNRVNELVEIEDFKLHPVTKKLVEITEEQIKIIENTLINEEELSEYKRGLLFKEKKVHQFYLTLFKRDGVDELKVLANNLEDELNNKI